MMQTAVVCSICGTVPDAEEAFCANCGHTLKPAFTAAPHFCPRCNSPAAPEDQICGVCGQTFERSVAQTEYPMLADWRTCLHCGARVESNDHFCEDAAASGLSPRSAQVQAGPASYPVAKSSSFSVVRILLGALLVLSLFVGFAASVALVMLGSYASITDPTRSEVASTFLVVSAFLFGSSLAMLFPRFYLVHLFASIAWVLGGFLWLQGVFGEERGFWPDWIFASGLANLIGGVIGFVISKIAGHIQKDRSRP